jgi:signal peptidase II
MMSLAARRARTLYLLLAVVVLVLDQASKWTVTQTLALGETRRILPGLFNLTHLRNRGAAFGLFADAESVAVVISLIVFSVVALVLVLVLLWRGVASPLSGWGLGLILGGALGNLFDRLRNGSVVDFLDFHLGPYHWPAFNVADSAIVMGAAMLMLELFWSRHRIHKSEDEAES